MAWFPFSITLIVFCFVGFVSYLKYREKMEMIRRGMVPVKAKAPTSGSVILFVGLISFSIGAALLVYSFVHGYTHESFVFGLILTFAGFALSTYWLLTAKDRKRVYELYEMEIAQRAAENKTVQAAAAPATEETAKPEQNEDAAREDDTTNILE